MSTFSLPTAPPAYEQRDQREVRQALERRLSTVDDPLIGTPTQISADQNDYATGNLVTLRLSSDASRNITGIAGGSRGKALRLINVGSQNIVIQHQNGLSSADNRVISATAADVTLSADDVMDLWYDADTGRWRIVNHYA